MNIWKSKNIRKFVNIAISIMVLASTFLGASSTGIAMPASPTDETKVPHYFGPWPNYANSPFTSADVAVTINGDGAGATAAATVGANGAITGINIINPGTGYSSATVSITGAGTGASASALVTPSGIVTSIAVTSSGAGYTRPVVNIAGGGGTGTLTQVGNPIVDRAYATDFVSSTPSTPPSVTQNTTQSYVVNVGNATGGTFTLTVDGATTGAIAWNAAAVDVQAALAAAGVTAAVSGSGSVAAPWVIDFAVVPGSVTMDGALLTVTATGAGVSAIGGGPYSVMVGNATGGTFTLTIDAITTAPIAWNALAADVETALVTAGVSATVTGSGSAADPWLISFVVVPASVTIDGTLLTVAASGAGVTSSSTGSASVTIGSATGGTFTLAIDAATTAPIAWNATAAQVQSALAAVGASATVTGTGSIADPWMIAFASAPASVMMNGALLTQPATGANFSMVTTTSFSVTVGNATGGTFRIIGGTLITGPIAWNATAAQVQAALAAIGVPCTVTGTGSIANPWIITLPFVPPPGTISTGRVDAALLTMGVANAAAAYTSTQSYSVNVGNATGGTFTLTVDAVTTGAIAWNAAAVDIQSALVAAGVTATVTGGGSAANPWVLSFITAPAAVTINGALLTIAATGANVAAPASTMYNVNVGDATGGTFALTINAVATAPIAWNALAADVQAALASAGFPTTVTGSGSAVDPWVITFAAAPSSVAIDGALLTIAATGAGMTVSATGTYHVDIGSATGGSFTLTVDGATTAAIAWNALAADVQAALTAAGVASTVTGSGSIASPWAIAFAVAPASVTINGALLTQGGAATVPVFVIVPTPLPAGALNAFVMRNQATPGASPTPSAGQHFNAYVLRSLGANQYSVIYDSGTLTVPALANPAVSENATFPVTPVAVQAGDVLAFYGAGIPVDTGIGADQFSYPAPAAPALGATITMGDAATFPLFGQAREYSFAASVLDTSVVTPVTGATATAYGAVDTLTITNPGSRYTNPTVDFDLPDDPNGIQAKAHVDFDLTTGAITAVFIDEPGSGYAQAPNVVIRDGTLHNPIPNGGTGATAVATISILSIGLDSFGSGYTTAPTVTITDALGSGSGATAAASVNAGGVTSIALTAAGSGYITTGGIKKFQDGLPVLCDPRAGWDQCTDNNLGQHIPIAVPDTTTFPGTDYYVIAVVQHREWMNSSLPAAGTLVREYVQLETSANAAWSKHVALQTPLVNGGTTPTVMPNGTQAVAVDDPHYLGPVIVAQKDRAVRITFYNLLPTGVDGDLFFPVDTTFMGSGMGPMAMMEPMDMGSVMDEVRNPPCGEANKDRMMCFSEARATLHLHGGITPWISDGTPHQWITPADEMTMWPQGVSVREVPDMVGGIAGAPDCSAANDGCMTFYYTNQQSARLMFYHDHSWGITRLNVYAGEAAGYLIRDATEQSLINRGLIPGFADEIPLVIQDRTFVPGAQQVQDQDPTWDYTRWGGEGNFWYEHVYMPAQNPGDAGGMSAYGRWMYGPWFWPPATPKYNPIDNPYYDPNCDIDIPATWQYQTDPFCEPPQIPGTPNNSAGMEQFNDTPVVNGTAYPTTNVQPKSYRLRILNAANDRVWNLQWYIADPTTGTDTEVMLNPIEVAAAQTDPVVFPTPLESFVDAVTGRTVSLAGPEWIQIGTEGGFLPAPVVIDGQQETTWITDPTRFDVGNVDKHSLLLAPAERADVIVDFSKFAGKTLILYNDSPAAFPARVPSYDYYTGMPDMWPNGPTAVLPGYGPNTRTIMQVKVAAGTPAPAFNLTALQAAFRHHADGSGVFESGQHPIIVGQSAYNSAYGTSFTSNGWCNSPTNPSARCDGFGRISDQGSKTFKFDTLVGNQLGVKIEPKAIHDEMNFTNEEPYGRMSGNLGVEVVPATPGLQNSVFYPFVNPPTELFDGTNLPSTDTITPISVSNDGTQIWKITHNGVDTHPIHFHLYDVQLLNRVGWDNIIIWPDANELGWKDTVRVSPLQDTYFAIRPIIPTLPFEIPNSIRPLNPMMPLGDTTMFVNIDANGNPTSPIVNQLVNFGWEYMIHCHILSHEEMDMMRPAAIALPPIAPDGLTYARTSGAGGYTLEFTWNDNSITETEFVLQKMDTGGAWLDVGSSPSPLDQPNVHGVRSLIDTSYVAGGTDTVYRIVARNSVGLGGAYMGLSVESATGAVTVPGLPVPAAPTNLIAALQGQAALPGAKLAKAMLQAGQSVSLSWMDNATNETGFVVERSENGGAFTQIAAPAVLAGTGTVTYSDTAITPGATYDYRVFAVNANGSSAASNTVTITIPTGPLPPAAPSNLTAAAARVNLLTARVTLNWTDNANNELSFQIQRATNATFTRGLTTINIATPNTTTYTQTGVPRFRTFYYRVRAANATGNSAWSNVVSVTTP